MSDRSSLRHTPPAVRLCRKIAHKPSPRARPPLFHHLRAQALRRSTTHRRADCAQGGVEAPAGSRQPKTRLSNQSIPADRSRSAHAAFASQVRHARRARSRCSKWKFLPTTGARARFPPCRDRCSARAGRRSVRSERRHAPVPRRRQPSTSRTSPAPHPPRAPSKARPARSRPFARRGGPSGALFHAARSIPWIAKRPRLWPRVRCRCSGPPRRARGYTAANRGQCSTAQPRADTAQGTGRNRHTPPATSAGVCPKLPPRLQARAELRPGKARPDRPTTIPPRGPWPHSLPVSTAPRSFRHRDPMHPARTGPRRSGPPWPARRPRACRPRSSRPGRKLNRRTPARVISASPDRAAHRGCLDPPRRHHYSTIRAPLSFFRNPS